MLAGTGSDQKQLVVCATGDRGLAGGFNSSVARAARDQINSLLAQGKDVRIICVGRKGRDVLRRLFGDRVIATFELSQQGDAEDLSRELSKVRVSGYYLKTTGQTANTLNARLIPIPPPESGAKPH